MPDNQMTESEIMKGLECCVKGCNRNCPLWNLKGCKYRLLADSFDLINRKNAECKECGIRTSECIEKLQKQLAEKDAEIERLNGVAAYQKDEFERLRITYDRFFDDKIEKARAEAIKEFANLAEKRICEKVNAPTPTESYIVEKCIEVVWQIAKEMGVEL